MSVKPCLTYRYLIEEREGVYQIDCVVTVDGVRYVCRASGRCKAWTFSKARTGLAGMIAPMFCGPFELVHLSDRRDCRFSYHGCVRN